MHMATEYGKRLRAARKHAGMTQVEASKATGIPQSTISTAEREGHGSADTPVYAKTYGVDAIWLATGEGEMCGSSSQGAAIGNITRESAPIRMVPLLSQVQAGMFKEIIDSGDAEMIATAAPLKRYSFALRVAGDSMLPTFPDGCIIYVDPEVEAKPGDFVIAENDQHEATFKKLVRVDSKLWLQPLNPQYRAEPLTGKILGKVRGMHHLFD